MSDLEEIRRRIDGLDKEMAELFEKRMLAAEQVAAFKREHGLSIDDNAREEAIIRKNCKYIEDDRIREYYVTFQKDIMEVSKRFQHRLLGGLRVSYCGVPGAFAHEAATSLFPDADYISYKDFESAYKAVEDGDCDVAVLPFENSFAGEVSSVTDLIFSGSLYVNQVLELEAVQNLLGCADATLESVKEVYSHPQALSQCASFLREKGLSTVEYPNTAMAAKMVSEKADPGIAAIGSLASARLYGLKVLEPHINTGSVNNTRFAALSRSRNKLHPKHNKMEHHFMLMFTVKNEAGSLAKTLNIIGAHNYNMCSLRSRPMKDLAWSYYFFVELDGNIDSDNGRDMLRELSFICDRLKLVGTY